MINKIIYTVVFLLVTTFVQAEAYQLKYRIQCATSSDADLIEVINKIPELNKFILPSGGQIYFSGQYFDVFQDAKIRLEEVKSIGFKDAFIRVFKYKRMLSKEAGDVYIEKVELITRKEIERKALEEKEISFAPIKEEAPKKVVKRKTYTREEINEIRAKRAAVKKEAEEEIVVKKKEEVEEIETKKEEVIEEEEDNVVDEAPIYKILLAKTKVGDKSPEQLKELADEVVYSYQEGNEKYFAVGFYETSHEAKRALGNYAKYTDEEPEIIGLYKGKIVSLKLANELHFEFKRRKK